MTLASDNNFPKVILVEAAAPATPDAGEVKLYAKTDGLLYSKDDAGAETLVSGGPGAITTKDEGTPLSTAVTAIDFVGAGVTASGAGATTTVTIPGQLLADPGAVWAATTAYSVGNRVKDTATVVGEAGVAVFECVVAGTSGTDNPFGWYPGLPTDGTVAWLYIGYIGGIDARLAAPPVAYAHDGSAYASPSAYAAGNGDAEAVPTARVDGTGTATAKIHAEYSTTKDAYVEVQATSAGANLAIHDGTSLGPGALISDGTHATWGRATYLDPTTATAHDIVDALIAAGLMAPS
jgi:hypothetical protein